jgi:hypothetical protein
VLFDDAAVDAVAATLGEIAFDSFDPTGSHVSPIEHQVFRARSPMGKKTSVNYRCTSCQQLAAPHRWLRSAESAAEACDNNASASTNFPIEAYRGAERPLSTRCSFLQGRLGNAYADFLPDNFTSLDI